MRNFICNARSRQGHGKKTAFANEPFASGVHVFTDGACEPNPGPGGWSFVVYVDGQEVYSETGSDQSTTNNRMELGAVLAALAWLVSRPDLPSANVHSDSSYAVNGCNEWRKKWRAKGWRKGAIEIPNADLWTSLDEALTHFPVRLNWVRGHSGIIGNEHADWLATRALSGREGGANG